MKLNLSPDLILPSEAVTQTFAILGKRGSGKTNTAVVLTEEMLRSAYQVVILDPLDVWFGLRSSADGKLPGFPITILGGNHADVPLESTAGNVIADFVVDRHASIVLSLRHFSNSEQRRFVTDFAERLFHRKGEAGRNQALHLVVDEADEFAPQRIMAGHERMFGAIDRIVRRGRASGLGVTLISQRAAVINKDILTQAEVLVSHQTVSPQDRKALEAWIEAHDARDQRAAFMQSLASLAVGEAWVWSPGWLDIFQRVKIRARHTFDSSATPKPGAAASTPKTIASVDLEELRAQMAETIERAKADDPKELRKRIAELERTKRPAVQAFNPEEIRDAERRGYFSGRQSLQNELINARTTIRSAIGLLNQKEIDIDRCLEAESHSVPDPPPIRKPVSQTADAPVPKVAPIPHAGLTGPEQRILDAIAWMESIGVAQPEVTAVAFLAGYTIGGGAFNNPKSSLRSKGLLDYSGNQQLFLTPSGRSLANRPGSAPTTEELQRRVMERLPNPETKILRVALEAYPRSITKEQCAILAGYEPGGGAFNNPKSRLRTLGLIEYPKSGEIRARDILFVGGRH